MKMWWGGGHVQREKEREEVMYIWSCGEGGHEHREKEREEVIKEEVL